MKRKHHTTHDLRVIRALLLIGIVLATAGAILGVPLLIRFISP